MSFQLRAARQRTSQHATPTPQHAPRTPQPLNPHLFLLLRNTLLNHRQRLVDFRLGDDQRRGNFKCGSHGFDQNAPFFGTRNDIIDVGKRKRRAGLPLATKSIDDVSLGSGPRRCIDCRSRVTST